jgi:outer membrane lipoprotein-sorting protein
MIRALLLPIFCLPAFLLLPATAQDTALTLDQIVQKHTDAMGGADKLKAIQTVTITGTASLMGGQMGAPVTIRIKRPAFLRMDMHIQERTFVQCFDGSNGWIVNSLSGPNAPQKMSEDDTRSARDNADFIEGSLVNYEAKGTSVELVGRETVETKPAYKLKVTKKGGTIEYLYLDAETFLPIKTTGKRKQMGQEVDYESLPSNYRAVHGVMMPFNVRQRLNGRDAMEVSILNVDVNTPIDDSIFRMPEQPREAR